MTAPDPTAVELFEQASAQLRQRTVAQLVPGDVVDLMGERATFIAQTQHPLWPHLRFVVWRLHDETRLPGGWSHDALDARQVVGEVASATDEQRQAALRDALFGRV